jgi:hypothetical protein
MRWLTLISALLVTACVCVHSEVLEPSEVTVVEEPKNKSQFSKQSDSIDVTNKKNILYY